MGKCCDCGRENANYLSRRDAKIRCYYCICKELKHKVGGQYR